MKFHTLAIGSLIFVLAGCSAKQEAPVLNEISSDKFTIETLADGMKSPWSVAEVGNGSYFVTERNGGLKFVDRDGETRDVGGLPDDIYADKQGGLHDVALPSTFVLDDTIYVSYAGGNKQANATRVFRARFDGTDLVDGKVIFTASPDKDTGSHFGGRIAFMPDNTLVLALGDGFVYREEAQNKNSHLGKTVRLNMDGSVPADNPFANEGGTKPEIYSWGHRNVQGLHYDVETGDLWSHEHGPKGGDELNLLKPGANYGWPLATTGVDYNGAKITPYKTFDGTESYVHDWTPSIAPSGLTIYRGEMFPDWVGDALVGGLASRDLRRIELENGRAVGEEIILSDLEARIRDVRTARDGAILIVTDDPENGKLLRMTPKK